MTQNSDCTQDWLPNNENLNDNATQIRYSINDIEEGLMTDALHNNIADTMVIYLNADDTQTFGLTDAPTNAPTQAPTETPSQAPTQPPTQTPTQAPTQAPTDSIIKQALYIYYNDVIEDAFTVN